MISELDTVFEDLTQQIATEDSSQLNYLSKPVWEFNEDDKPTLPVMFLALPLNMKIVFSKFGLETRRYTCEMYCLIKSDFENMQSARTPLVDQAHDIAKRFIKNLGLLSTVTELNEATYEDVYKFLDVNCDGVRFVFAFNISIPC